MKFATFNDSRIGIVMDSAIVDVTEANLGFNAITAQDLLYLSKIIKNKEII